jgi:hypothetical protein
MIAKQKDRPRTATARAGQRPNAPLELTPYLAHNGVYSDDSEACDMDGSSEDVSNERLTAIVLRLNSVCRTATLSFAMAVGELVITHLYSGDVSRWRSRDPHKEYSMRKLARHPYLAMSPSVLYRSIAIYEVCERLGIRSWTHVSSTHIRIVLPLSPNEQSRLLRDAEANRWSAQRLEEETATCVRSNPSTSTTAGGRKRTSPLTFAMHRLERSLSKLETLIPDDGHGGAVESSPDGDALAIRGLEAAARRCMILQNRLEGRVGCEPDEVLPRGNSDGDRFFVGGDRVPPPPTEVTSCARPK